MKKIVSVKTTALTKISSVLTGRGSGVLARFREPPKLADLSVLAGPDVSCSCRALISPVCVGSPRTGLPVRHEQTVEPSARLYGRSMRGQVGSLPAPQEPAEDL